MKNTLDLPQKMALAALSLFLQQGIKKTSLEEVAQAAGVTRVTVYRYFGDKANLTCAAFDQITAILEETRMQIVNNSVQEVEAVLDLIATRFTALPSGDLTACLDELNRLYPDSWRDFHQARREAIGAIFDHLFEIATAQGRLRAGLRREFVQAYFMSAVVSVLESPDLLSLNLSTAEIFASVKDIFLYGILTEPPSLR